MPHNYNRAAFNSIRDSPNKLVALYSSLVRIELALKDQILAAPAPWPSGHRIITWLTNLPAPPQGIAALAIQLSDRLATLRCRARDGSEAPVSANSYPDLRYLLHEQDFPGRSTDAQLDEAIDCVRDIEQVLGPLNFL